MYDSPQADLPRFVMPPTLAEVQALAQTALDVANANANAVTKPTVIRVDADADPALTAADGVDAIYLVTNAHVFELTLPAEPTDKQEITVVDSEAGANQFPITIKVNTSVNASMTLLYNRTDYVIETQYGSVHFIYNAVAGNWDMI